jgi:hypothetical protein
MVRIEVKINQINIFFKKVLDNFTMKAFYFVNKKHWRAYAP